MPVFGPPRAALAAAAARGADILPSLRLVLTAEALTAPPPSRALELNAELDNATAEARLLLLPRDPDDRRNAIIEVRAGAGGDEAGLIGAELLRKYMQYAARRGWKKIATYTEEMLARAMIPAMGAQFYPEIFRHV